MARLPLPEIVQDDPLLVVPTGDTGVDLVSVGVWVGVGLTCLVVGLVVCDRVGLLRLAGVGSGRLVMRCVGRRAGWEGILEREDTLVVERVAAAVGVEADVVGLTRGGFDAAFRAASVSGDLEVGTGRVLRIRERLFGESG